ncbi:hypothetical protein EV126DRAFT_432348 [Verticillium dahliae]|nr:hypothetical protein EV126DRAFT_432348 [Verticillium dahliae]
MRCDPTRRHDTGSFFFLSFFRHVHVALILCFMTLSTAEPIRSYFFTRDVGSISATAQVRITSWGSLENGMHVDTSKTARRNCASRRDGTWYLCQQQPRARA